MARPIEPVAVRRNADLVLEVQSKGGVWFPWSIVSDTVKRNVRNAVGGRPFPADEFLWNLSDLAPEPSPTPHVPTEQAPQDDAPQEQEQEQDAPQPQPQPQRERSPLQLTIEDIVREIAGEMDTNTVSAVINTVTVMIDDALARHVPTAPTEQAPTTPLTPVVTRIEVHTPTRVLSQDGLFHKEFGTLLQLVQIGMHTYLPGSPGTGKSHAASQVAKTLGYEFGGISFGPQTAESRLVGGMTANGEFFEPMMLKLIRHAMDNPDSGSVMCLDEMDNGHGGVQATLNSLLANGWMTAPNGDHLVVGPNMVFVACANTYGTGPTAEFSGRNKLDAATLDRFKYLPWEIDLGMESALVHEWLDADMAAAWLDIWRTTRQNVEAHGLKMFVTPRGAISGAKMIAHGMDMEKTYMLCLGNKVPADQFAKISAL